MMSRLKSSQDFTTNPLETFSSQSHTKMNSERRNSRDVWVKNIIKSILSFTPSEKYEPPRCQIATLGIHFGLEYVSSGIYNLDTFTAIPDENSYIRWSNWISFPNSVVIGAKAKSFINDNRWTTIQMRTALFDSEKEYEISINGLKETIVIEEVIALVLAKVRAQAQAFIDCPSEFAECVIAVPSMLNHLQRLSIFNAAQLAGFKVLKIISELSAAAICYHSSIRLNESKNVSFNPENICVVYTNDAHIQAYDAAVFSVSDRSIEMKSISGPPYKDNYKPAWYKELDLTDKAESILKDAIKCSEVIFTGSEKTIFVGDFSPCNLEKVDQYRYEGVDYRKAVLHGVCKLAQILIPNQLPPIRLIEVTPHVIAGFGCDQKFTIFDRNSTTTTEVVKEFLSNHKPILSFQLVKTPGHTSLSQYFVNRPSPPPPWRLVWRFQVDSMGLLHVHAHYLYPNSDSKEYVNVYIHHPRFLSHASMAQLRANVEKYTSVQPNNLEFTPARLRLPPQQFYRQPMLPNWLKVFKIVPAGLPSLPMTAPANVQSPFSTYYPSHLSNSCPYQSNHVFQNTVPDSTAFTPDSHSSPVPSPPPPLLFKTLLAIEYSSSPLPTTSQPPVTLPRRSLSLIPVPLPRCSLSLIPVPLPRCSLALPVSLPRRSISQIPVPLPRRSLSQFPVLPQRRDLSKFSVLPPRLVVVCPSRPSQHSKSKK